MAADRHTWTLRHSYHGIWENEGGHPKGWTPLGIRRLGCGCYVDDYSDGTIWEPCMAHEGDGHVSALSETDGSHVARCLVLICPWQETWMWETDAISAAQRHWRDTRTTAVESAAGKN